MGTLTSQSLRLRMGSQWSQIKTQCQTIIKNNYSQQQFHLHSIPNTEKNNIKLYFIRQFSCLPRTPKIICLQKQQTNLLILIERSQKILSQWLQQINCQLAVLMKLNDVLHGIHTLKNRFGCFIVTQKMVQLSVNQEIMVWYNEKFHSNIIQLPLTKVEENGKSKDNQSVMVWNVIEIFRKNSYFSKNLASLFLEVKAFKEFHHVVKRRIHEIQTSIGEGLKNQSSFLPGQNRQKFNSYQQRKSHGRNPSIHTQKRLQTKKHILLSQKNFSHNSMKIRHKSFLLEQAQKLQQNQNLKQFNSQHQRRKSFFKQNLFPVQNKIQPSSSQRYSSSEISSKQFINQTLLHKNTFKPWRSFHHTTFIKSQTKQPNFLRKKQCGYRNLTIYQFNEKQNEKQNLQNQAPNSQSNRVYFSPTFKPLSPTHGYRAWQSFNSSKQFSLKSTTGTLKKTREFIDQSFRQLIACQHQTIKQQSDETYKNSKNYSVQTIKEEQREEQKCSPTVSQDFNQLFSARSSSEFSQENQIRELEFERILWGTE